MAKKFLQVFGIVLLYMVVWALLIVPVVLWFERDPDGLALWVLLGMIVLIFVLFVPFFNASVRRVFHFAGIGKPISEAELRARILTLNDFDAPAVVEERGKKLVVTWRYVDARWWELLAKAGLTQTYECHIKLDPRRHEAIVIDVKRSVNWRTGPNDVSIGFFAFRGVDFSIEIGKQWGIREDFSVGKVYDYKFTTQQIKQPVVNTLLQSGWDVRFAMW
jgi:hypothetical protein